jgi:predicted O-methyltransferase YrrM
LSIFQRAKYHLSYFLNAVNQHSLQAPFIYELYTKVIKSDKLNGNFSEIESIRAAFLDNNEIIKNNSLGAPSKKNKTSSATIKSIASGGITSSKYSALLYRIIKHFRMREIVELGTSLGVNTLYLAKYEATKVTTFEGDTSLTKIAQDNFNDHQAHNINIIEGNIDKTLSSYFDGSIRPDLVYIDANHTYEATLKYFNIIIHNKHDETIVVIDDIKWSESMQRAWKNIVDHPEVTMSIDLNKCGMVFFKPDFTKQHYVLAF